MELLPDEKILLESDPKGLILTTHRVRSEAQVFGGGEVISIMLDELASCGIIRISNPLLLIIAAFFAAGGFIATTMNLRRDIAPLITGVIIALGFVVIYYTTRREVLVLASSGATIKRSIKGMSLQMAMQFINATEAAKNQRYILGRKL